MMRSGVPRPEIEGIHVTPRSTFDNFESVKLVSL
jgi:hypothetical protein